MQLPINKAGKKIFSEFVDEISYHGREQTSAVTGRMISALLRSRACFDEKHLRDIKPMMIEKLRLATTPKRDKVERPTHVVRRVSIVTWLVFRADGVHELHIKDLVGHTLVRMTSVYTHQTPANLCNGSEYAWTD
jgi:hypothetical protein